MTSRLDRLFVLLEAGTGAATRRAAARQLGEVQKAHPEELHRLLGRLMRYLRSPVWETRVAASQAVESILSNVPEWNPLPYEGKKVEEADTEPSIRLRCETFNIDTVLQNGAHLMGSEGHEYDFDEDSISSADLKERLSKQRQQLNSRLGLDMALNMGVDLTSMYTNEDLCPAPKSQPTKEPVRRPVQELVLQDALSKPLSSRERNLAKRKARQAAFCKQKSRECDEGPSAPPTPPAEPDRKKIKVETPEESFVDTGGPTPDCEGTWGEATSWPLDNWCGALQAQLFSGAWEARHGAATALRALLRSQLVDGAGKKIGMSLEQMEEAHQEWLEDMALRLLCVLALDRFGDFVSDQVVAPVRETSAQTLGVTLATLKADRVAAVARLLATLARHQQWEARHGALLGLKYLLAARQDVACESGALEHLINGLGDCAEDVSAVAAGALVPASNALATKMSHSLKDVVTRLWQLLHEQDDLAAPANSYMTLLASLMSLPQAANLLHPIDLSDVLPRLWPYLDHSTSSVRKATLQTLVTITKPLVLCKTEGEETSNGVEYLNWNPELLQEAMRHVYQRIIFEHAHEIQDIALQVWRQLVQYARLDVVLVSACPVLAMWLCAAMNPARLPIDPTLILPPPTKERRLRNNLQLDVVPADLKPSQKWYLGGGENQPVNVREKNVMRARCMAADALGLLSCYLIQPAPGIEYKAEDDNPIDCYVKVLTVYLRSGSALQRLVSSLVISSWARHTVRTGQFPVPVSRNNGTVCERETDISKLAPSTLTTVLHTSLNQALYYDEVALTCNKILQEARDLHAMMKHYKLPVDGGEFDNIMRLEQVLHMTTITEPMVSAMKSKRVSATLEERRKNLQNAVTQCSSEQCSLNISVQASLAGACANLHSLPEKLNPVIRPLMESIKKEGSEELQLESANNLAVLLAQLISREPCPNNKVLANLKAFLRCDPEFTPRISTGADETNGDPCNGDSGGEGKCDLGETNVPTLDQYNGILTLWEQQRAAEKMAPKRGRPSTTVAPDLNIEQIISQQDEAQKQLKIRRRGATLAMTALTKYFNSELPEKLPKLWEFISEPFVNMLDDNQLETQDAESSEELISRLQVFETVCPYLHEALWPKLSPNSNSVDAETLGFSAVGNLTRHRFTPVRHMAARALAARALRSPQCALTVAPQLIPALGDMRSERVRCGAAEALARLVDAMQLQIVPYIPLFVVPLLGRMSDPCEPVRVMSTRCFAALIQLMPLDGAVPEPPGLSQELRERRDRDKKFLDRLFNPKSIQDYQVPVSISAQLRSYQQAGVNWLRFLNEYKLHGVLCDDMGLGKTLQCICVVAGSHYEREKRYRETGAADAAPMPSLVVCPPTLTGHWVFEVNKFIPGGFLKALQYVGPPIERERLRLQVPYYSLIVASYDIVRKDIEFFSSIQWNYCILDEGHVIKNGKTKAFQAIKRLVANHRLILSGTPIQNNVLELWSLFDFLMPGLLGTERQFTARYSRPILAAREPRATHHQLQAGALACEALHRQVLPFLLRRVKEDVLKELPPKITQDYYCELSPLQRQLYEDFSKAHMPQGFNTQHAHVFQALHYLQNVCNHPKLVLKQQHPEAMRVAQQLAVQGTTLDDINHSAKLPALKQLLLDCGIGTTTPESSETVVSQHRALIFCQLKKMLDIVEQDLLKRHLPSVSYLRLDGSVSPAARHSIVTSFNNDPTIDLLLLTTKVGGLGLNLTGADTVIFVEHDWNPMKDLQAMDRAHRIGQKKVVNVYRLITRDTLEEKIMGLQKFKLQTANTVISSENAAMETMGTEQLLDLVQSNNKEGASSSNAESLSELWDHRQYEEEYDMTAFIQGLHKMNT